ncbi:MAG: hypothetical protein JWO58_3254 [Chitinophagaceae bacterium]|nr:hypothetical protein [Chitinophagaceae bacterium]
MVRVRYGGPFKGALRGALFYCGHCLHRHCERIIGHSLSKLALRASFRYFKFRCA